MKLIFVCTGNICRSPLAEGYIRHLINSNHLLDDLQVDSAGICALNGHQPSLEAMEVAEENGFDIADLESKQLGKDEVQSNDIIVVMAAEHRKWIEKRYSVHTDKIQLLRSYSTNDGKSLDVPDPIGLDINSYRGVFNIIKRSVDGLYNYLLKRNKNV